jgi:hypothetical protein
MHSRLKSLTGKSAWWPRSSGGPWRRIVSPRRAGLPPCVDRATAGSDGKHQLGFSLWLDLCRVRVLNVPMLVGMVFGGLRRVMFRVQSVAVGCVSVMRALFMVAILVVFGGRAVVLGRVFVVLRGFVMMIDVIFGHGILS